MMFEDTVLNRQMPNEALQSRQTGQMAFWGGILFSLFFTILIWWGGGRLTEVAVLPDQGPTWYYWKLAVPTFWSQATAWGGYLLHQFFMWGTIYYARKHVGQYTVGLHRVNLVALLGNATFVLLHFAQTQLWYDGLAQNTSLQSSEASVVLLLVVILIMENRRRGLFFGNKAPLSTAVVDLFRHYHGYIFAWAVAYTFWFHPMVATSGHLVGFFYIFMLMVQGSLFYTRMHLNRWWNVGLEVLVLAHGAMVVYMSQGSAVWAFILGFMGIFLITQMHGLKMSVWARWGVVTAYSLAILAAANARGMLVFRDIVFIPVLEYGLVFLLTFIVWFSLWVQRRLTPSTS